MVQSGSAPEPVPADEVAENTPDGETADEAAVAARVAADQAELSSAVAALTDEDTAPKDRRRLLGRLVRLEIGERGVKDLFRPKKAIGWIADSVTAVAPHIQLRDLETLRAHFGGIEGDELAERLIRNAGRVTAGIGAAGGGVAAVEWVATPSLLSAPVLLAAETVAVVAVEMKLIGELHAVYGRPVQGTGSQRALALIQAWAERRGINPMRVGGSVAAAMGTAVRKELRDRLLKRFGRNLSTLGPFLTGAAVGGFLNRRATHSLGAEIRKSLQGDLGSGQRVIEG